jgi:hypothetical protein
MDLKSILSNLREYSNKKRKESNWRFFKTGSGEYGEGDQFIGVSVPDIRRVAKKFFSADFKILRKLLKSKIHEERMLAVIILTERFIEANEKEQKKILNFYLKNLAGVNN